MSLLKLLSTNGFISYNKTVANQLGVHEAILLGELCSIGDLYNYNEFYFERSKIINDTALSDSQIRNATKTLVDYGLIGVTKKGIPCKYYYTLNEEKILQLFTQKLDEQVQPSATKIAPLVVQQSQDKDYKNCTTFNNKNTSKNTSKNTTSGKPQTGNQLFKTESKPKKKGENKYITVIEEISNNPDVRDALLKYCNFRRQRGLTIDQWSLIVTEFKKQSAGKTTKQVIDCINQCIINGRNSLYYVDYQNTNNPPKPNKSDGDEFDFRY